MVLGTKVDQLALKKVTRKQNKVLSLHMLCDVQIILKFIQLEMTFCALLVEMHDQ